MRRIGVLLACFSACVDYGQLERISSARSKQWSHADARQPLTAVGNSWNSPSSMRTQAKDSHPSKNLAAFLLALNPAIAFAAPLGRGLHCLSCSARSSETKMSDDDPVKQVFSTLFPGGKGKQIYLGVLQKDVDPSSIPSDSERTALRAEAAASLTNIDMPERERRRLVGSVLSVLTLGLAIGLIVGHAPTLTRFAIAPPLFFSYGYLASWQTGL